MGKIYSGRIQPPSGILVLSRQAPSSIPNEQETNEFSFMGQQNHLRYPCKAIHIQNKHQQTCTPSVCKIV